MLFYTNNRISIIENRGVFLRHTSFKEIFKGYLKILIAFFISKKAPIYLEFDNYFLWKNKRIDGSRFYGVGIKNNTKFFLKIEEPHLTENSIILENSFLDFSFKYYYPSYDEWKSHLFKDGKYHGDANITNILKNKLKMIVVDWEKLGTYSNDFQHLDYLINHPFINRNILNNSISLDDLKLSATIFGIKGDDIENILNERIEYLKCNLSYNLICKTKL